MGEVAQVCAEIFWHKKLIAPSAIQNPTPSLDPGSVRGLETKLRRAYRSTTSRLQLRSIY